MTKKDAAIASGLGLASGGLVGYKMYPYVRDRQRQAANQEYLRRNGINYEQLNAADAIKADAEKRLAANPDDFLAKSDALGAKARRKTILKDMEAAGKEYTQNITRLSKASKAKLLGGSALGAALPAAAYLAYRKLSNK